MHHPVSGTIRQGRGQKGSGCSKMNFVAFYYMKVFFLPTIVTGCQKKTGQELTLYIYCKLLDWYILGKKKISPAKTIMNENRSNLKNEMKWNENLKNYLETCFLNGCGGNGPYCIISRNPANNHQTVRQKLTKTISRRRRKSRSRRKPIPRWQKLRRRQKLNKSRRQRQRPDQKMQRPTIPRQYPKLVNQKWSHLKMCKSIFSFLAVKHFF